MGERKRDTQAPQFCDACFSGAYPIALPDLEKGSGGQLSLLADVA
jgi:amidophosphoribosyltransferase